MLQIHAGRRCKLKCQNHVWKHFEKPYCQLEVRWCAKKTRSNERCYAKLIGKTSERLGYLALKHRDHWSENIIKNFVWRAPSRIQKRNQDQSSKIIVLSSIKNQRRKVEKRAENFPTQTINSNSQRSTGLNSRTRKNQAEGKVWWTEW